MELNNDFEVNAPVEKAWAVLTDVEKIAPCLPGAQLQEVEGDEYRGIVKVKVGPITAQYKGAASFLERGALILVVAWHNHHELIARLAFIRASGWSDNRSGEDHQDSLFVLRLIRTTHVGASTVHRGAALPFLAGVAASH